MPNFKIRRRRKQVSQTPQTAPPPNSPTEEKIDQMEEIISESEEERYIDNAMSDLKISKLARQDPVPQKRVQFAKRPQYAPQTVPQYQKRASVAYQQAKPASYPNQYTTQQQLPNQYTRKPTMQIANPRSKLSRGGNKLRFNSHYGADGEHLDTRTKSIMLYNHCFG